MLEAARGWLTPAVLFVLVNLVIATIAVASRLMAPAPAGGVDEVAGGGRRALLRAPSLAVDRLRASFSFSRLGGLASADHAPLFDYAPAEPPAHHHPPATGNGGGEELELERQRGEEEEEEEEARIERSRSEAAAELAPGGSRRPRARRTRRAAAAEEPALARDAVGVVTPAGAHRGAGRGEEPPAVEVDELADDFIQRFREQLRLQRLDSILRYRDTLRRTGTA